jgi:hypothetical protein
MIPLISIFLSLHLASLDTPKNNPIYLKTYISENAKIFFSAYWINEEIEDRKIEEKDLIESSQESFLKKLYDKYMIEYHTVGSYYFFNRKQK